MSRSLTPWKLVLLLSTAALGAEPTEAAKASLTHITADSLRGHLSFLSSDLLEGRGTPSKGLDIAAEYIAAQFRRAGLEPAGDQGYFQTARYLTVQPVTSGLRFEVDGKAVDAEKLAILETLRAVQVDGIEAVKFKEGAMIDVAGKAVVVTAANFRELMTARRQLAGSKAAVIVVSGAATRSRPRQAMVPESSRDESIPSIAVLDNGFAKQMEDAPAGPLPFKLTVRIAAPDTQPVLLKNVAALLRGSDPALQNSYAMVTAHYDHLGMRATGEGDRIFNGANDDGSGTVSVIEIASALASMNPHPRRSILFVAFFGEEMGLLGSRYYGAHPLFPLAATVADVNLEHMGRTDSDGGPHVGMVNFTGFDFSNVPAIFREAGNWTDIQVVKDEKNSDPFFARSDNQAMADMGVPAHTISVGYEFPDYHRVGDEWPKIDFENMARVDRMVALGLFMIANDTQTPHWNEDNAKAAKYVEAWRKLQP